MYNQHETQKSICWKEQRMLWTYHILRPVWTFHPSIRSRSSHCSTSISVVRHQRTVCTRCLHHDQATSIEAVQRETWWRVLLSHARVCISITGRSHFTLSLLHTMCIKHMYKTANVGIYTASKETHHLFRVLLIKINVIKWIIFGHR